MVPNIPGYPSSGVLSIPVLNIRGKYFPVKYSMYKTMLLKVSPAPSTINNDQISSIPRTDLATWWLRKQLLLFIKSKCSYSNLSNTPVSRIRWILKWQQVPYQTSVMYQHATHEPVWVRYSLIDKTATISLSKILLHTQIHIPWNL